ncbi:MAG: hypothetical protein R3F55_16305 [Alphaproteobacteria bacterium]
MLEARTMPGGARRMMAIGRGMTAAPQIPMLDEPSLGLSPLPAAEPFKALAHVRATGVGVLPVEQDARLSLAIADRGYLLENGQVTGAESAAALRNDPNVQRARPRGH